MSDEREAAAALLGLTSKLFAIEEPRAITGGQYKRKSCDDEGRMEMQKPAKRSCTVINGKRSNHDDKARKVEIGVPSTSHDSSQLPVEPRVIYTYKASKTHLNHSYRDFSTVQPEKGYKSPTDISIMSFAAKLHHILSSPEYSSAIAWEPHGRAFRVLIPRQLEKQKILSRYFGHNQYSKFLSDLRNHGLKSLTTGRYKGCYYHECMLRGLPHLCKYMPEYREDRRLRPDPKNEPDFDKISALCPLPSPQGHSAKEKTKKSKAKVLVGQKENVSNSGAFSDIKPNNLSHRSTTTLPGLGIASLPSSKEERRPALLEHQKPAEASSGTIQVSGDVPSRNSPTVLHNSTSALTSMDGAVSWNILQNNLATIPSLENQLAALLRDSCAQFMQNPQLFLTTTSPNNFTAQMQELAHLQALTNLGNLSQLVNYQNGCVPHSFAHLSASDLMSARGLGTQMIPPSVLPGNNSLNADVLTQLLKAFQ